MFQLNFRYGSKIEELNGVNKNDKNNQSKQRILLIIHHQKAIRLQQSTQKNHVCYTNH
jgi:hypothetical protein